MKKPGPPDPDFESRIRSSFARQGLMKTIGANLVKVAPGEAEIELPYSKAITQQHGFVHAGIVSTIADNACGYAAYTLMPADSEVLGVESKINFLAPAKGERLVGDRPCDQGGSNFGGLLGRGLGLQQRGKDTRCSHADDNDDRGEAGIVNKIAADPISTLVCKSRRICRC